MYIEIPLVPIWTRRKTRLKQYKDTKRVVELFLGGHNYLRAVLSDKATEQLSSSPCQGPRLTTLEEPWGYLKYCSLFRSVDTTYATFLYGPLISLY
jgi:hypothetical protein